MENLRSWEAIEKLNELLGEDIEEQFNEQEEKTGIDGSQFLVSNSKGLAIEVEIGLSEDGVDILYTLNTDWAK